MYKYKKKMKYTEDNVEQEIISYKPTDNIIISCYPLYTKHSKPESNQHHLYCKFFLIMYKPFSRIQDMEDIYTMEDEKELISQYNNFM